MSTLIDITEPLLAAIEKGWNEDEFRAAVDFLVAETGGSTDWHPLENWAQVETDREFFGLVFRVGPLFWVKPSFVEPVESEFPDAEVLELSRFDDKSYTGDLEKLSSHIEFSPDLLDEEGGFSPWDFSYETIT